MAKKSVVKRSFNDRSADVPYCLYHVDSEKDRQRRFTGIACAVEVESEVKGQAKKYFLLTCTDVVNGQGKVFAHQWKRLLPKFSKPKPVEVVHGNCYAKQNFCFIPLEETPQKSLKLRAETSPNVFQSYVIKKSFTTIDWEKKETEDAQPYRLKKGTNLQEQTVLGSPVTWTDDQNRIYVVGVVGKGETMFFPNLLSKSDLKDLGLPKITSHPQSVTKKEGENVTLSCNATGNPVPKISWTKSGSAVGNDSRISFQEDQGQLTITDVRRTDKGEYQCVVKNNVGHANSDAATLNVEYQPKFIVHPKGVDKREGEELTLSCEAIGNPEPTISWNQNGAPLNTGIKLSDDQKQLTIEKLRKEDSGEYRCVAFNSLGIATSNPATVNVQYEPQFMVDPGDITETEGQKVTFSCDATGNPEPKISWIKDGSSVSENPKISFSDDKKQMTIRNVRRKDGGEYRCVAENHIGKDMSKPAILKVKRDFRNIAMTIAVFIFPVVICLGVIFELWLPLVTAADEAFKLCYRSQHVQP